MNVNVNRNRDYVWEPQQRYGGRPVVRGNEGRVYTGNTAPRRGGGMAGGAVPESQRPRARRRRRDASRGARQPRRGVRSTIEPQHRQHRARDAGRARSRRPAVQRAPSNVNATALPREPRRRSNPAADVSCSTDAPRHLSQRRRHVAGARACSRASRAGRRRMPRRKPCERAAACSQSSAHAPQRRAASRAAAAWAKRNAAAAAAAAATQRRRRRQLPRRLGGRRRRAAAAASTRRRAARWPLSVRS